MDKDYITQQLNNVVAEKNHILSQIEQCQTQQQNLVGRANYLTGVIDGYNLILAKIQADETAPLVADLTPVTTAEDQSAEQTV